MKTTGMPGVRLDEENFAGIIRHIKEQARKEPF